MNTLIRSLSLGAFLASPFAAADGIVRPPVAYQGSLEEKSQEAIIVFRQGTEKRSAVQDLILKIQVEGEASEFGWIVPLPNAPQTTKADPKLFEELHQYVQKRKYRPSKGKAESPSAEARPQAAKGVRVLSRKVVGSYDVAVVRETVAGSLQGWLTKENFQPIEGGDRIIESYRKKNYVFACMKVSDVKRAEGAKRADLHPLRFTFETGGRDGIYFPMRLTGLQKERFDVNLYVFYAAWLNDNLNNYGYLTRGFRLNHRDWDTAKCEPNAGKLWSDPVSDPYLRDLATEIPSVAGFFRKHYNGQRFYLTNLQARGAVPTEVRNWPNDLWMFPYYTNKRFVPFDKRDGGAAVD